MPTSTNTNSQATSKGSNPVSAIIHLPRTFKVAGAVMKDARVHVLPKIMFVGGILVLLAALLTPEALAEFVNAFPVVGQVLGALEIPVDGAIDWLALGLAAFNLMKLFPQDVVNEHLSNITQNSRPTGRVVDADPN
ncbi:MAG TPA: hypothetical protein VF808_16360 [Ktedonobacterales bacterium]